MATKRQIDWDERDFRGNTVMDCLKLQTQQGSIDEVVILCQSINCQMLCHSWQRHVKQR